MVSAFLPASRKQNHRHIIEYATIWLRVPIDAEVLEGLQTPPGLWTYYDIIVFLIDSEVLEEPHGSHE